MDAIRNETISQEHIDTLNNQLGTAAMDTILLSTHRGKVDEINIKKIAQLPGQEYIYE
ncbi:MAG: hypothetical protein WCJ45_00875 [bacterium]